MSELVIQYDRGDGTKGIVILLLSKGTVQCNVGVGNRTTTRVRLNHRPKRDEKIFHRDLAPEWGTIVIDEYPGRLVGVVGPFSERTHKSEPRTSGPRVSRPFH